MTPTPEQIDRLVRGREDDPFALFGVHPADAFGGKGGFTACVLLPDAVRVVAQTLDGKAVGELAQIDPGGLFHRKVTIRKRQPLRYVAHYADGRGKPEICAGRISGRLFWAGGRAFAYRL